MTGIPLPLGPATDGPRTTTVEDEGGGAVVRRSVLPSGARVLTESMPGQRSVSFGCWVGVGSRDETRGQHGSTHFLEHLLFKGTSRRDAMDIATAFDAVGGEANAATGKEHTTYYARILDEDLPMAIDVVTDMVTSAVLDPEDFDSEREVILEELAMNDDDPADVAHERFAEVVLGDHPLGRPIGGTPEAIRGVGRDDVWAHYRQHYEPRHLVFTAAGGLEHEDVCARVQAELERAAGALPSAAPAERRAAVQGPVPGGAGRSLVVSRPTEQAHLVLGCTGVTATDGRRFTLSVLNAVLGGGMSSRLFQEVREKRGLAYSVYSFNANYSDGGYVGLYAGCSPAKADQVAELMLAELVRLADDGLDAEELRRGIGQLAGGLCLGLEDSGSRMSRLGKAELVHGEFTGLDTALARLRAVTARDVQALAADLVSRPRSIVAVGPFDTDHDFSKVLS
ncbi:putative Zn-dependent peptidase [Kineococcus xinjiangensis]|uniref:Putative Zn-dependent peptidase n=1 Tax=Kineococcus xinjiangensis TaxID=512762 RepID=A0A2S6IVU6_9ACTN|nr:pitrilysin family protein [Kineococcus xinjiangensis]PPK98487.1 putative Zn-dependent peptidase [Kineococcus xinjiangensis]